MIRRTVDRGALNGSAFNRRARGLVEAVVITSTDQLVALVDEHLGESVL